MKEEEKRVEELSDEDLMAGLIAMVNELERLDGQRTALEQVLAERLRERSLTRRLHPEQVLAPPGGWRRRSGKPATFRRR